MPNFQWFFAYCDDFDVLLVSFHGFFASSRSFVVLVDVLSRFASSRSLVDALVKGAAGFFFRFDPYVLPGERERTWGEKKSVSFFIIIQVVKRLNLIP